MGSRSHRGNTPNQVVNYLLNGLNLDVWWSSRWIFLSPKRQSNKRMKKIKGRKALASVGSFMARELVSARSCRWCKLPPKGLLEYLPAQDKSQPLFRRES